MLRCWDCLEDAEAVAADVVGRPERVLDVERVDVVVVARLPRQVRAAALRGLCAHLRIDRLSHSALCQVCIRAAQPACPTQLLSTVGFAPTWMLTYVVRGSNCFPNSRRKSASSDPSS